MSVSEQLGEAKEVQLAQGRLRYRDRGRGKPIVFLHGVFVNGDLWRDMVPVLSPDYRCITPDLPLGSHDLPLTDDADLSPLGMSRLIADFLVSLGLKEVTLVGQDTGGAFAQLVATRFPGQVSELVLLDCDAFENFPPRGSKLAGRLLGRFPVSLRLLAWALRPHFMKRLASAVVTREGFPPEIGRSYIDHRRESGVWRDVAKVARSVDRRYTLEAARRLAEFDGRTLLLWAPRDLIFPFKHAQKLVRLIPNAELIEIHDSRPFLPEDQPVPTAKAIGDFLRQPNPALRVAFGAEGGA